MINTTETILFLLPANEVFECYQSALIRLDSAFHGRTGEKSEIFTKLCGFRPTEDIVLAYVELLFELSMTQGITVASSAEKKLITLLGVGPIGVLARRHLKHMTKVLLMNLYKERCLLLPYVFTRPLLSWLDDLPSASACYTEIILVFRSLDTDKATGGQHGRKYIAEEKKNRRIFQMATKLVLSSTWYSPEEILIDDFLAWRDLQLNAAKNGMTVSPLPLEQISDILKSEFPSRMAFGGVEVRKASVRKLPEDLSDKFARLGSDDFFATHIMNCNDPLELVSTILDDSKMAASHFIGEVLKGLDLPACWRRMSYDIGNSVEIWAGLETDYLEAQSYENPKQWNTLFGRLNLYLFLYLPGWFRLHPDSGLVYPNEPNKFIGKLFYNVKHATSGSRPLTFVEFYGSLGWEFYYASANNLRLFFEHLIDFCFEKPGCKKLTQPVNWLPKSKKSSTTTKHAFSSKHEDFYIRYLEAIDSAQSALEDFVKSFRFRYDASAGAEILFETIGYIPFVNVDGANKPIWSIDRRALVLVKISGEFHYNPATVIFPYCLVRGGLRGQNLQWLAADSFAMHVDRDMDSCTGLSYLYINTDKIREEPFTVICRYSVIAQLDRQAIWRDQMHSNYRAAGFKKAFYYNGKKESKWGAIQCLFCNDAETGEPISDSVYTEVVTYSQLGFQTWMRVSGLDEVECVAFIGIPPAKKSRKSDFYTWDQWQVARQKSGVVKIAYQNMSDGRAPFCPVNLRAKVTSHGGRATHITQLLTRLTPEEVAKTTGQTVTTVIHYDTGKNDFRRRFAGVVNNLDPVKRPLIKSDGINSGFEALLGARGTGDVSGIIKKFGLLNFSDKYSDDGNEDAFGVIAREKSANIIEVSTHICAKGFVCPGHIVERFNGGKLCPWCPYAIFSLNSIFAVAAKRHQLAEDFKRIQEQLAEFDVNLSNQELKALEADLKFLGEELLAWYFLERSMDALIFKRGTGEIKSSHIAADKDIVRILITRHVVERGSPEEFLRRLDEVCQFPSTMSVEFRDKVNRAIRLVLAQRGDIYQALLEPVVVNPEIRLAALIRDDLRVQGFDIDRLVALLTSADLEWFKLVSETRALTPGEGDSDAPREP
ncbi:hypothetical protein [Pseudomonas atacamensis]|uniref:hypothetical protein n=1 Tax=Pseudomonas atacamensis TaxID=2565368 RepID=UPI0024814039|nr:hypothetical protein [Pseudomonas atacamensis]WGT34298.1 hypothetical protein QG303_01710 [Pseudomonas atacamensis]